MHGGAVVGMHAVEELLVGGGEFVRAVAEHGGVLGAGGHRAGGHVEIEPALAGRFEGEAQAFLAFAARGLLGDQTSPVAMQLPGGDDAADQENAEQQHGVANFAVPGIEIVLGRHADRDGERHGADAPEAIAALATVRRVGGVEHAPRDAGFEQVDEFPGDVLVADLPPLAVDRRVAGDQRAVFVTKHRRAMRAEIDAR